MENMTAPEGKTKEMVARLKNLGWEKVLLVDESQEDKFTRSCKNLKACKFITTEGLNVYDLLKFDRAAITPATLKTISRKCGVS